MHPHIQWLNIHFYWQRSTTKTDRGNVAHEEDTSRVYTFELKHQLQKKKSKLRLVCCSSFYYFRKVVVFDVVISFQKMKLKLYLEMKMINFPIKHF